ncbi:RNA ligase family protein [Nocardia sp. alder85J]|uniref:RNA ligase family protein n=1 Tax=Nocardia sp. alder85J TaxID=2862949 RepID=UPI001CD3EBE9|nr:RNA ligase family protein [Nocardia sp. alder85J]MCX4097383.1 RNA ligase family protein [Nocardia sp. alder85J]
MNFDVRTADLDAINSATKYPSIPTYHGLGERGALTAGVVEFRGPVVGTEKVDGTNSRVIGLPDGSWLLGSREELLCARGDLIGNPAQGIVAALRDLAEALPPADAVVRVLYLEVYGGKVTAASKQYTGERGVGYRLFDMVVLSEWDELSRRSAAELSAWRESGGQRFATEDELTAAAADFDLELTPRLFTVDAAELPHEIEAMREFLGARLPGTRCRLDAGAGGHPEGIVLRTPDRSAIAKARFEDYDRTLRRRRRA